MVHGGGLTLDIESFIRMEEDYFSPMRSRSEGVPPEQLAEWRLETVRERQTRISQEVFELMGGIVGYGPFRGMQLSNQTWWGKLDLGSQVLGLYESEILGAIELMGASDFKFFIDIGAADGYYAVGMLVSEKVQEVICYEANELGRATIERNWIANKSPGKLRVLGEATEASILSLQAEVLEDAFVLIDIEGYEFNLLTGPVLAALSQSTVIIEVHNWVENFQELYAQLLRRADQYFEIQILPRQQAQTVNLPELRDFTDDNRLLLTSERRPCVMRFLKLVPKA